MNFEWEQYICLACKLIKSPKPTLFYDAYLRTAMSRSYYGVYGVASTYLLDHHTPRISSIPQNNPHKFVIEQFKGSNNRMEIQIGEHMGRLWRGRKDADYVDVFEVNSSNAEKYLQIAMYAIRDLKILERKYPRKSL
jgi:uncharacterized protein (UPF0332 family)